MRPSRIYVAADGPRSGVPGDRAACLEARKVLAGIDWPCEVKTLLRATNLGVKRAVSEAIDWFFEFEEEGIILEEDCFPHPDFFPYCDALLEHYRQDERVMQISGTNFQPRRRTPGQSYFFSRYSHVWGWATWKRAWVHYRRNLEGLEGFLREASQGGFWENRREQKYWRKIFAIARADKVQSWAYRWTFSLWAAGGVCIYPEVNLVSNLGFGAEATNTTQTDKRKANRISEPIGALVHPATVMPCRPADRWTFEKLYWGDPVSRFVHRVEKVGRMLSKQATKWTAKRDPVTAYQPSFPAEVHGTVFPKAH